MDKEQSAILKRFSKAIKTAFPDAKVYLFGSRARGENLKTSDYDFIVVSSSFKGIKTPKRLEQVYAYWDERYNADILPYTPEELAKQQKLLTIANKAMQEAVEL
jgi:predicted nucleotidyltransferase